MVMMVVKVAFMVGGGFLKAVIGGCGSGGGGNDGGCEDGSDRQGV